MKILYLTDPGIDYLADLLYIGLCRVLGNEQVVDCPLKSVYHRPESRVHYIPQVPAHQYSAEDIVAMVQARHFDLFILSSSRPGVVEAFETLKKQFSLPPLVLFDGEDDPVIQHDFWAYSRAAVYFKRELKLGRDQRLFTQCRNWLGGPHRSDRQNRLRPLPFSVALNQVPAVQPRDRVVDVSYAGRVSHPRRKQAVDALAQASDILFEGGVYAEVTDRRSKLMTGLPRLWTKLMGDPYIRFAERGAKLTSESYFSLLSRSKMALSVRGGGFDTLRYWEIVATKTLLLSELPDIEIPNNFVHGQHALFFKPDLSDLIDIVRTYAKDEGACTAMAQAGYDHLLQYHTCERRAEYVLDICRRLV